MKSFFFQDCGGSSCIILLWYYEEYKIVCFQTLLCSPTTWLPGPATLKLSTRCPQTLRPDITSHFTQPHKLCTSSFPTVTRKLLNNALWLMLLLSTMWTGSLRLLHSGLSADPLSFVFWLSSLPQSFAHLCLVVSALLPSCLSPDSWWVYPAA